METRRRIYDLADYIVKRYRSAVEIGIGHFPDLAFALRKRGVNVFGTDIVPFRYHGIQVVIDDITEPHCPSYRDVEIMYSMRPPLELVPFMERLAKKISADLIVKPLSGEHPGGRLMRYGTTTFFSWNKV